LFLLELKKRGSRKHIKKKKGGREHRGKNSDISGCKTQEQVIQFHKRMKPGLQCPKCGE